MRGFWSVATSCLAAAAVLALAEAPPARAQAPHATAEWATAQGNPQRTGWQKDADGISPSSVQHFKLLWTAKTGNEPYQLAGLVEPLIVNGVSTPSGTKDLAIVAGSASNVYAIDMANGQIVWQKHLVWSAKTPEVPKADAPRGFICENALIDVPVVTPAGAGAATAGEAPGGGTRYVYVVGQDGYLHTFNLSTGEPQGSPTMVTPVAYPKVNGLQLLNHHIYTAQGQGCGDPGRNPNTIYDTNLATGTTTELPPQSGIWGDWGVSVGPDGNLFAATGDGPFDVAKQQYSTSIIKVSPAMKVVDYYTPARHEWLTQRDLDMNFTPVVVPFNGKTYVVSSGKEGRYYVMDSAAMGGAEHAAPEYETPLISNLNVNFQTEGSWGGAASWKDANGTTWVLAPTGGPTNPAVHWSIINGAAPSGGVIAMKLAERGGKAVLDPYWRSPAMVTSQTPVVAGGVVFALGGGEFTGQANDNGSGLFSAAQRVALSVPAVLFALDAQTGKELWHSGHEVTSFVHQGGVAVADGKAVFGTNDGTVYCYGLQ